MQLKNWNDLRDLLAIKRGATITAAARLLSVDDTTVSRRLAALQVASGSTLFSRQPDGRLRLTASGDAIAQCAEVMERQVEVANESLGAGHGQYAGSVKLTSVPIVANRLLVPAIGKLLDRHPALQLELIPDGRDLSLSRREADLAIRLARPSTGGASVKARRIGTLQYSVYAPRSCSAKAAAGLPWIT
jgi:DNA-binding transcriptional LysR family regulator